MAAAAAAAAAASSASSTATTSIVVEDPFLEAQVQQLLQDAGLESAPFDPASFEALKHHLRKSSAEKLAAQKLQSTTASEVTLKDDQEKNVDALQARTSNAPATEGAADQAKDALEEEEEPPLQNVDIYGPTFNPSMPATSTPNTPSPSPVVIKSLVPLQQRQALFSPMASDVTDPGSSVRAYVNNTNVSNISAISGATSASKTEARILEQLQVQTSLILQLQRRVDELTDIVQSSRLPLSQGTQKKAPPQRLVSDLTAQSPEASSSAVVEDDGSDDRVIDQTPAPTTPSETASTAASDAAVAPDTAPPPRVAEAVAPQQQQRQVPPIQRAAPAPAAWRPLEAVRNSRMAQLWTVFKTARKQQVQDIQWGVIIKVVVMMSILLGRMISSSRRVSQQKESDGDSPFANIPQKFYYLIAVVVLGLLAQTGYLQFLYKFCVKDRYPHRILIEGENADDILRELEDLARPDPRRAREQREAAAAGRDGNNNGGAGAGGIDWDRTFLLGGRIARAVGVAPPQPAANNEADDDGNAPPVPPQPIGIVTAIWNGIVDVLYLIGSFFLSIFPMWKPQAAAVHQPAAADGGEAEDGPGQVRAPVDPAADDDDV